VLAVSAPLALAQAESWVNADDARAQNVLVDRDREAMRMGDDPLNVVGIAQGDNDFRKRTPALANTTTQVAFVDVEEAYRRQLAMHSERAAYTSPPTVRSTDSPRATARPKARRGVAGPASTAVAVADDSAESSSFSWAWLVPVVMFVVLFGVVLRRRGYLFSMSD
jgi:hypothetical protein